MGIRWVNMDRISDKMGQDGAKMRKMKDLPRGRTPSGPPTPLRAEGPGKGREGINASPGTGEGRGLELLCSLLYTP